MSLDFASFVSGCRAPDRAMVALLSSCVAKLVMHPTALHWTSTFGEFICLISGARPPRETMATLFSAAESQLKIFNNGDQDVLFTAKLPKAALAARCTSMSGFCKRNKIGSKVSRSTSLTSVPVSQHVLVQVESGSSTSFCYLSEGQTRGPLQINIVGIHKGAQCPKGFAGEEVGLGSLGGLAVRRGAEEWSTYIFEEPQEVGDSLPLAVGQHGIVDAVL